MKFTGRGYNEIHFDNIFLIGRHPSELFTDTASIKEGWQYIENKLGDFIENNEEISKLEKFFK